MVFPYRKSVSGHEFAVFNRSASVRERGEDFWQCVSGGAEATETPLQAAIRESREEARIPPDAHFTQLDSTFTVPSRFRKNNGWGPDVYVIKQYVFGVGVDGEIALSDEHVAYRWLVYDEAIDLLKLQTNAFALEELRLRLERNDL